jgi:hypothetical protein
VWLSDGTTAGTRPITTFGGPGYGAAALDEFFSLGSRLFWAADDGALGSEPWTLNGTTGDWAFVRAYGPSCLGANGLPHIGAVGIPQLGNTTWSLTCSQAQPASVAIEMFSAAPAAVPVGGCLLLLALPVDFVQLVPTDAAGNAIVSHPIPNLPVLVGANLFFQWAIVDSAGPVLGFLTVSDALQAHIGR